MMETERVLLTAIEPDDVPAIVRWRNLPAVYQGFIEYEPLSTTRQREFLDGLGPASTRRLWMINARTPARAADLPGAGEPVPAVPVGTVGIMNLDWRNRQCEFGPIFIGEMDHRGHGLATEAELLVLDYCFNHLGLHKVIAHVPEGNAGVNRLHEVCGFRHEVLLREHIFRRGRFEGLYLLSCLDDEFRERFPRGFPDPDDPRPSVSP